MRFSCPLISAVFFALAVPGGAQLAGSQPAPPSPSALPKGSVPVYRLHSHAQVTFLTPDSLPLAGAANNSQRCYTIRQYQFEQADPKSDATKLKDYSACMPATRSRLKSVTVLPAPPGTK